MCGAVRPTRAHATLHGCFRILWDCALRTRDRPPATVPLYPWRGPSTNPSRKGLLSVAAGSLPRTKPHGHGHVHVLHGHGHVHVLHTAQLAHVSQGPFITQLGAQAASLHSGAERGCPQRGRCRNARGRCARAITSTGGGVHAAADCNEHLPQPARSTWTGEGRHWRRARGSSGEGAYFKELTSRKQRQTATRPEK